MNLRNVLRAYSLLRILSDEESALLETLRAANDNERQLIAEAMSDKPQKKSSKKGAGKGASKSARASGMAAALNKSLQQQRKVTADDGDDYAFCAYAYPETGLTCGAYADANVHHKKTEAGYHPFHPLSSASPATSPSSANGAESGSGASSATGKADASNAAHGGD